MADPATHALCRIEDIEFFPSLMQVVQEQLVTTHPVELIDCAYNKGGVLVALHRDDLHRLDAQYLIFWLGEAYPIVPFNLAWADPLSRVIHRKWLDRHCNRIRLEGQNALSPH